MNFQNPAIGVYFSANDAVYDWAIAFLNSFRTYNPKLRLILIPFNAHCERLLQLKQKYDFEVYDDPTFQRLEAIGQAFELGCTPTGPYWFRRYASFWGPLDRFIYLDARQIVLADLKPFIESLDRLGFDFLHYDCAIDQVYEPGSFRQMLIKQGRGRGFISGCWISRKELFSIEEFERLAIEALKIRNQLNRRNTDQAFINYCCDSNAVRLGHWAEVVGGICQNGWARQPGAIYQSEDRFYLWDYGGLDHRKQVILIHWAGYKLNALFPHRRLFEKFRYQNTSLLSFGTRLPFWLLQGLKQPANLLRENRILNTLYHRFKG